MAWEDNCRTTKVFFEPELRWGEYRTVRVYPTTTFAHLREKLLEKQKSCKDILSCYEIYFKYKGIPYVSKQDFTPHPDSRVLEVLAREEELWLGSIELTLRDRRLLHAPWKDPSSGKKDKQQETEIPDYNRMFKPSHVCYDMLDQTYSVTNLAGLPTETDEPHPEDLLFEEIENMGMQLGMLERKVKSRDMWKPTYCALDVDKLWIAKPQDTERVFSFVPLDKDTKVEEEGSHSFSITSPDNPQKTVFRAASKEEMEWWTKAIRHRESQPAENEMIQLADAHICDEEWYFALEDIHTLCRCAGFEGALVNTSMRVKFQEFLEREHSEELFLFWQHVEAYKLRHPDNPNAQRSLVVSAVDAKNWAHAIYETFVSENAIHQVSTSGQQLTHIQENLEYPTWDMFDGPQKAAFAQLRTSSYTRFVQLPAFRHFLLNVPFETRKHWRALGRRPKNKGFTAFDTDNTLAMQRIVTTTRATTTTLSRSGTGTSFGSFFKRKKAAEEQWNEAVSAVKTKLHDGAYPVDFSWQPASWWNLLDLDDNNEDTLIMRLYPPWGPSNFDAIRQHLFALRDEELSGISPFIGSVPEFVNRRMMFVRTLGDPLAKPLDDSRSERSILHEQITRTMLHRQGRILPFSGIPGFRMAGKIVLHGWVRTIFNRAMQAHKQPALERQTTARDRRSVVDDDNPLNPGITAAPQPEKRYCVLAEFEGRGVLYFWESAYSAPSAVIYLESVTAIMPSEIVLHCIEMHDVEGVAWCIAPEGVDDDDFHTAAARWMATLSRYCPPTASRVTILQEGPLSKRGKVNTGFKRRWFMLTSAGKMLYFKEDNGQCKGDISTVRIQSVSSTGARDFTVHTPDRTWVFAAESQEEMEMWVECMKKLCDPKTN